MFEERSHMVGLEARVVKQDIRRSKDRDTRRSFSRSHSFSRNAPSESKLIKLEHYTLRMSKNA